MICEALHASKIIKGQTNPVLFICSDYRPYVVKFGASVKSMRRLVSEFIGSELSRWAGLPTPECAIIDVSEWLIRNTAELATAKHAAEYRPGLHFGSSLVGWEEGVTAFDYLPECRVSDLANTDSFAGMLAFDLWTSHCDTRQAVFIRKPGHANYSVSFIDFSQCFSGDLWRLMEPVDSILRGPNAYRNVTGWDSFEPFLTRLESIPPNTVDRIRSSVPPQWCQGELSGLDRLLDALLARRSKIRSMIDRARMSHPTLFPSWQQRVFILQRNDLSPTRQVMERGTAL